MKVYSEFSGSSLGMGSGVDEQWAVHAVLVAEEAVLWQSAGIDPERRTSTCKRHDRRKSSEWHHGRKSTVQAVDCSLYACCLNLLFATW